MKTHPSFLDRVIRDYRPGFTLRQALYIDPEIFNVDLERATSQPNSQWTIS